MENEGFQVHGRLRAADRVQLRAIEIRAVGQHLIIVDLQGWFVDHRAKHAEEFL
jgi:hypothetical protein